MPNSSFDAHFRISMRHVLPICAPTSQHKTELSYSPIVHLLQNKWHCHKFNVSLFAHFLLAFCHLFPFSRRRANTHTLTAHCLSLQFMLKLKLNVSFIRSLTMYLLCSPWNKLSFARHLSEMRMSEKGKKVKEKICARIVQWQRHDTHTHTLEIVQMEKFLCRNENIKKSSRSFQLCALFILHALPLYVSLVFFYNFVLVLHCCVYCIVWVLLFP